MEDRTQGEGSVDPRRADLDPVAPRPVVRGRFIFAGDQKVLVRGATYGPFRECDGTPFPDPERVESDFRTMASCGLNALRTYTVPPVWLLDAAARHGLYVMVGLPWEQHIAFLDDRERPRLIEESVRAGVRACAGHPTVLCYAIGNEIPASIVRWHGRRTIERFLQRLYLAAKDEDPEALVTYVNYPSTEYLNLPFLDFASFNVFLESEATFERYLARLQNLADDRPLLVTEAGLDSGRNGEAAQAAALRWQVSRTFASGASGVFIFSWTDEWHRGGADITDWSFGVVDSRRRPKPSLEAVTAAFSGARHPARFDPSGWDRKPTFSVIVCTYNGEATIGRCLDHVLALDYPNFDVVVVDDGSDDSTAEIVRSRGLEPLVVESNGGLAHARNEGLAKATGTLVAYVDDDAYPDPDWLSHLSTAFAASDDAAVGGPNLPPDGEGTAAAAVAEAPGGPVHVLIDDREAEHIPGCNMAFKADELRAIGGFDPQFRIAGDDVDVCWQLQEAGHTIGFSAGAVVMHSRRRSVRAYLRQQYEYGKAEALLERKWPSRYNRIGHLRWEGRMYGGTALRARRNARVSYGTWGTGLFQSIYEPLPGVLSSLTSVPEWYLALGVLAVVALMSLWWAPLVLAAPVLALAVGFTATRAFQRGWAAHRRTTGLSGAERLHRAVLTSFMFAAQPLVRLAGRLRNGLSPWRSRVRARREVARSWSMSVWSESWMSLEGRLTAIERLLRLEGAGVTRGGEFDRWDLRVETGFFGAVRMTSAIEEHGDGRQLLRVRLVPEFSGLWIGLMVVSILLAAGALADGAVVVGALWALMTSIVLTLKIRHVSYAVGVVQRVVHRQQERLDKAADSALDPAVADGLTAKAPSWLDQGATGTNGSPSPLEGFDRRGPAHRTAQAPENTSEALPE